MSNALPKELEYLAPVFASMLELDLSEIDESFDTSELDAALATRLRGQGAKAARSRLAADRALLAAWLESQGEHPAHFVIAYIEPAEMVDHLRNLVATPPRPTASRRANLRSIRLELPPEYRALKQGRNQIFLGDSSAVVAMPTSDEESEQLRQSMASMPGARSESIQLGALRADKCTHLGRIFYFLRIEGQGVQVVIDTGGKAFDERGIEACLAGIELV
jgi:hypothetical protein